MWTLCNYVYIYISIYLYIYKGKKRDNNRDRMGSTHSEWDPAFPGSNVVAPRDFKRIFSDFKPQFAGWKQQDPRWVMSWEITQR